MAPNRVVAITAAVVSLALAVLPVVGNLDWSSTAGVIAGVTAILGVTLKWLDGWQKHERAQALTSDKPALTIPTAWLTSGTPSGDGTTAVNWNAAPVPDEPAPLNVKPVAP